MFLRALSFSLFFSALFFTLSDSLCVSLTCGLRSGPSERSEERRNALFLGFRYITVFFFSKLSLDEFTSPLLRLSHICDSKKKNERKELQNETKNVIGSSFCFSLFWDSSSAFLHKQTNKEERGENRSKEFSSLCFLCFFF